MKIPEQDFRDFEKRAFLILRFIIEGMSQEELIKKYSYEPREVDFVYRLKQYCFKSFYNRIKKSLMVQNE